MAQSWWLSLLDGESPIHNFTAADPNSAPHFLSQAWQWAHSSSHPPGCPLKGTFPWHRPKPEKNGPQRQRLGCRVWGESVGFAEWWLFCRKCKICWYFFSITTMDTCFLMFWQPISWLGRAFWFNHVTFSATENLVPIPNKWPQLFAASCLHRCNCSECAGSNMNILWGAWTVSIRLFDFTLYVIPLVRLGRCKVYLFFFAGGKNDWQTPFNQPTGVSLENENNGCCCSWWMRLVVYWVYCAWHISSKNSLHRDFLG